MKKKRNRNSLVCFQAVPDCSPVGCALAHIKLYIHFNPVKHGLVNNVKDWPWCSFHRYVNNGHYDPNCGTNVESFTPDGQLFGE